MSELKINYTVGGVLWIYCSKCDGIIVIFHSRFEDHVPYCKNCNQEYKLKLVKVERK